MTRVFVPYTALAPGVIEALAGQFVIPVALGDKHTAYGDFFQLRWDEGQTFVSVEHDVIVWPGAIDKLLACPEPWCIYDYRDDLGPSWERPFRPAVFGCVKFGAALIEALPDVWTDRAALGREAFPWVDGGWMGAGDEWRTLDSFFWLYAAERGHHAHLHLPSVHHAHNGAETAGRARPRPKVETV